ncbi:hypothetical protein Tco_0587773, partial [Tanacetum coccineum]
MIGRLGVMSGERVRGDGESTRDVFLASRILSVGFWCSRLPVGDQIVPSAGQLGLTDTVPVGKGRLHQGPGLDDYAKTFSSLLLAEIDKRNLNPLKQMRVIEQLRPVVVRENLSALVAEVPSASALQVLRRLGSIFTSVVASGIENEEGLLGWSLQKVVQAGGEKRLLYVKRNKAISLGNATSKVGIESEFIMAQLQRQADVHQDESCPPNKRYALMDANKK